MTGTNNNFTSDSEVPMDSDTSTNMTTPNPDPITPQTSEDAEEARLQAEALSAEARLDELVHQSREHEETDNKTETSVTRLEEGVDELGTDLDHMDRELTEEEKHAANAAEAISDEE